MVQAGEQGNYSLDMSRLVVEATCLVFILALTWGVLAEYSHPLRGSGI